jgi:hypothetical protein
MMITGERNYRKVVSVAEFAPDDYLVKPFTANQLLDRLIKISRKKDVFARAFAVMESGRPEAALPECRAVAAAYPEYSGDAYRFMIDMLLGLKRYSEAESLIKMILDRKLAPWAYMGLANIRYAEGRLGEAEGGLCFEHEPRAADTAELDPRVRGAAAGVRQGGRSEGRGGGAAGQSIGLLHQPGRGLNVDDSPPARGPKNFADDRRHGSSQGLQFGGQALQDSGRSAVLQWKVAEGAAQIRSLQVSNAEVGAGQVSAAQVRVHQLRLAKRGAAEVGAPEIGP